MKTAPGLGIVVFSGGYDRVHYALVMASAAAAINRRVTLFFTGRALPLLLAADADGRPGWHRLDLADDGSSPTLRDRALAALRVATLEELIEAIGALEIDVIACEMGLRVLGIAPEAPLRPELAVTVAGVVTFLGKTEGAATLFV
ncbi:MAG: hypothetical protein GC191_18970 [Azospirillum sp.]|nr:hypothetical protein [Azospirillum sp.]